MLAGGNHFWHKYMSIKKGIQPMQFWL